MARLQVVSIPAEGEPVVFFGDPDCSEDPCARHGRCHCMCRCFPDGAENCSDCAEMFNDD